ncbi:hypothetical protein DESUT3_30590 [Desulfuromonas versatilis]|uniref:Type II secretion system protein GspN n=1 Tax=Desulfuromonas versatilis TaxID=2802975 RepID=A0ABM7NFX9_9BACT|nr:type II secretion system protein GspN [Desulfuromonas versatilis]BCR05990.1 hypothetical protein DESUT3_30590 [Desulfuromonas versatilis]
MKRFRLPSLPPLLRRRPVASPGAVPDAVSAPNRSDRSRLRLYSGAALLLAGCLVLGFYLFFPAGELKNRIEFEVTTRTPARLEMEHLSLRFPPALRAQQVNVTQPGQELKLTLDSLTLKPLWHSLFGSNPGVAFASQLLGGNAWGNLRRDGAVEAQVEELTFSAPLAAGSSLGISGVVSRGSLAGAWPLRPETETSLALEVNQARLTGLEAIGATTPNLSLGTLTLAGSGRGTALRIDKLENQGGDLQVSGTGTLLLSEPPENSRVNLSLTLNRSPSLDQALVELLDLFIKPGPDGTYRIRVTGTLGNPRMR